MIAINYEPIIENESERAFYEEKHTHILNHLTSFNDATFWQIVREVGGSDRRTLRLLNQMVKIGELEFSPTNKKFNLPNKKEEYQFSSIERIRCGECGGKMVNLWRDYLLTSQTLEKIYTKKPTPTFLFDQRPVTFETTERRAAYLLMRGDLIGKEIVFIGDDDLTSLAIALTQKAKRVVVFDIDMRLIDFINNVAKEENIALEAHMYDLTKHIPNEFSGKFDVFLTDPTPNREMFSLFVSIGLMLLKGGKDKIGYVSFFPSHQERSLDFQEVLTENKLIVTDMIPQVTEYDFLKTTYKEKDLELLKEFDSGEQRLSFHENFTRFETTEETPRKVVKLNPEFLKVPKATRRVLKDLSKDPAYASGEVEFVKGIAKKMMGVENE